MPVSTTSSIFLLFDPFNLLVQSPGYLQTLVKILNRSLHGFLDIGQVVRCCRSPTTNPLALEHIMIPPTLPPLPK